MHATLQTVTNTDTTAHHSANKGHSLLGKNNNTQPLVMQYDNTCSGFNTYDLKITSNFECKQKDDKLWLNA